MAKEKEKPEDYLVTCLHDLGASGPTGFEGLMRNLLERWTGKTFRLSSSGAQHGRDARSDDPASAVIYAEMKRYGSTALSARELLAELDEAHQSDANLDLWILVVPKEAGEQNLAKLEKSAREKGIELLVLDARDAGVGPIQAFCAAHPDLTSEFLATNGKEVDVPRLQARLDAISRSGGFEDAKLRLQTVLGGTMFGFADARARMASWLAGTLKDLGRSKVELGQDVAVADQAHSRMITRRKLWASLSGWWNASKLGDLVLIGEEGTGKSWAAMSWLLQISSGEGAPLIVPVTSNMEHEAALLATLAKALVRALQNELPRPEEWWRRKLMMWLKNPNSRARILVLFDGVNESRNAPWPVYLSETSNKDFNGRLSLILTTRKPIWTRLKASVGEGITELETDGYDDDELKEALTGGKVDFAKVPDSLMPLLNKPRFCDMVIRNYEQMLESEDFTAERLLYEEFRDRQSRKLKQPIDEFRFKEILGTLASKYIENLKAGASTNLRESDVEHLSVGTPESAQVIQEIIDGGLLEASGVTSARYKVNRRRLVHGLGLLLLEHLSDPAPKDLEACRNLIQEWLEPHPDLTLKGSILGAAVFHALAQSGSLSTIRRALWIEWLQARNLDDEQLESIRAYFPAATDDVLSLVDMAWKARDEYGLAQERLMQAFWLRRDDPRVLPKLAQVATRWMSYVHVYGFWHSRRAVHEEDRSAENKAQLERKLGKLVELGKETKLGKWTLLPTDDDGCMQLARLAILIISNGRRKEFIPAILAWAVSRAAMDDSQEFNEIRWLIRLSPDDCWPEMAADVEAMAKSDDATLRVAALTLCRAAGTSGARKLRKEALSDLDKPNPYWVEEMNDPCTAHVRLDRDQCRKCLERTELDIQRLMDRVIPYAADPDFEVGDAFRARLMADVKLPMEAFRAHFAAGLQDHLFERFGPVLARFAPGMLRNCIKRAVESISGRNPQGVNQMLVHLPEYAPLCDAEGRTVVRQAVATLREGAPAWEVQEGYHHIGRSRLAEAEGTLSLAMQSSQDDVTKDVISRPREALDLLRIGELMERPTQQLTSELAIRLTTERDPVTIRRITWAIAHPGMSQVGAATAERLADMTDDAEIDTRHAAMRYGYLTKDSRVVDRITGGKTRFLNPIGNRVDAYGVAILVLHGAGVPLDEMLMRMPIVNLSFAVHERGLKDGEVRSYGKLLGSAWEKIFESHGVPVPEVPQAEVTLTEFGGIEIYSYSQVTQAASIDMMSRERTWGGVASAPSKEEIERVFRGESNDEHVARVVDFQDRIAKMYADDVKQWAIAEFDIGALRALFKLEPDLVRRWTSSVTDTAGPLAARSRTLRHIGNGFFQSLAWALITEDASLAYALWEAFRQQVIVRLVHPQGGAELMICLPFIDGDNPRSDVARRRVLAGCRNNLDYLIVASAAAALGRQDWLMGYARELAGSATLHHRAAGMMIAASSRLADLSEMDEVIAAAQVNGTWLEDVAVTARELASRHVWARHWYRMCLETKDEALAWSHFRVALSVADRRFWLTMEELEKELAEHQPWVKRRIQVVGAVEQPTSNAIEKNEKEVEKLLYACAVNNAQMAPWAAPR